MHSCMREDLHRLSDNSIRFKIPKHRICISCVVYYRERYQIFHRNNLLTRKTLSRGFYLPRKIESEKGNRKRGGGREGNVIVNAKENPALQYRIILPPARKYETILPAQPRLVISELEIN